MRNFRGMANPLCSSILAKVDEQIERLNHLTDVLPPDRVDWAPTGLGLDGWTTGRVLGHLLDCLAGFCAVLAAAKPERAAIFSGLRSMPVNHTCKISEARERMAVYRRHIDEGFEFLADTDLSRLVPTVFVAGGETVLTLLLGNLEHLINHKHQLFTYLKLMGAEVGTRDLYHFRNVSKG